MTGFTVDGLSYAILEELAQATGDGGMSLPKLGKRLQQGASVVLRQLTLMSDAAIAGQPGPGWVRIERDGERWLAFMTDAGRTCWEAVRQQP